MANKSIEYYLKLPWTIELIYDHEDESQGWFVRIKELPGCMSQADTPNEAVEMILDAMEGWLSIAIEDGFIIKEPLENMEP